MALQAYESRAPSVLLSNDQQEFRQTIATFVQEEVETMDLTDREWRRDPDERHPWEVIDAAAELNIKNLTVPEAYGGEDASTLELCLAVEELAAGDLGIAVVFDQCWKIAKLIDEQATAEQRDRFFPEFVEDPRHLLAITVTEKEHGSNHLIPYEKMRFNTTADKDGDEWVINGEKRYISNGADAKTYVVRAQTDPDRPAAEGSTDFIVPRDTDGVRVTNVWEKMSQRIVHNATIKFDDVRIPEENLLGDLNEAMAGHRVVPHPGHTEAGASTIGVARRAFELAFDHAERRQQGGTEIIDHQSIAHDFAEMATELQAARSLIWTSARTIDETDGYSYPLGSMAKLFAAETSVDVCKRTMEMFGGDGIMLENRIQKQMRDALSFLHSDGTQRAHKEKIYSAMVDA